MWEGVGGREPPHVNPGGSGGAGRPPQLRLFVLPHQYFEKSAEGGDKWYANDAQQQRKNNTICLAVILACRLACCFAGWLACWLAGWMTIWLDGTSSKYPKKTEAGGRHIGGVLGEEPPNVNPGGSGEARKPPPVASFRSAAPVRYGCLGVTKFSIVCCVLLMTIGRFLIHRCFLMVFHCFLVL